MICFKEEHPSNTYVSITFNEEGIVICFSEVQSLNAYSLISFTFEEIYIFSNDEHSRKDSFQIKVTEEGIIILHSLNAPLPIELTEYGTTTLVIEHLANE